MRKAETARRDLVDTYIHRRTTRGELSDTSAAAIRYVLLQWHRHTDWCAPRWWTQDQAEEWVCADHLSLATRKTRRSRLRPYLAWLHDAGHLDRDIGADLPAIRLRRGSPRDLPDDAVRRMLAVAPDDRARLIIVVMVQLGLRCGDLARVRIEDIDRVHRELDVRGKGGRGEVTHTVPIPGEAWRVIAPIVAERRGGPLVVSYTTGRALQPGSVSVILRQVIRDAGLKHAPWDGVSAHALRHTCAQGMLDRGAELRDVQYALGHRSLATTEVYARRAPRGLADAMEGRAYLDAA